MIRGKLQLIDTLREEKQSKWWDPNLLTSFQAQCLKSGQSRIYIVSTFCIQALCPCWIFTRKPPESDLCTEAFQISSHFLCKPPLSACGGLALESCTSNLSEPEEKAFRVLSNWGERKKRFRSVRNEHVANKSHSTVWMTEIYVKEKKREPSPGPLTPTRSLRTKKKSS